MKHYMGINCGEVLDNISYGDFQYIIGLDITTSYTSAWLYRKCDDEWTPSPLKLDAHGNIRIPTVISYNADEGEFDFIGYDADPRYMYQYFMAAPDQWDNNAPDGKISLKKLANDYIENLWYYILTYNEFPDDISDDVRLIVAGCQYSIYRNDSMGRYGQLIAEAVARYDYNDEPNVIVLPKSLPAAMYASGCGDIWLSEGMALIDIGCTNTDFVYILPGDTMITRSADWGGAMIDRQMLACILKDNELKKSDIPMTELNGMLVQIREMKEKYYSGKDTSGMKLYLPDDAEEICGDGQSEPFTGIETKRWLNVNVNEELMARVLEPLLPELEEFFLKIRKRIGRLPCKNVVLAGGSSRIPEIEALVKIFGEETTVRHAESPECCTAAGLALAKCSELMNCEQIFEKRDTVIQYIEGEPIGRFCRFKRQWEDILTRLFLSAALEEIRDMQTTGGKIKVNELIGRIRNHIFNVGMPINQKLQEHILDVRKDMLDAFGIWAKEMQLCTANDGDIEHVIMGIERSLDERIKSVKLDEMLAAMVKEMDVTRLFFYSCIDDDIIKRKIPLMHRVVRSAAAAISSIVPDKDADPKEWRNSGPFSKFPELLDEDALADGSSPEYMGVLEDYNKANYYLKLMNEDAEFLQRELLNVIGKKYSDGMINWTSTPFDKHISSVVYNSSDVIKQAYDYMFGGLYEEFIGKMMLQLYDGEVDLQ